MARVTITVEVDSFAFGDMLEAWGDGSINWDREDAEPVETGVIEPIKAALAAAGARIHRTPED